MTERRETIPASESKLSPEQVAAEGDRLKSEFQETLEKIPAFQAELNKAFFEGRLQTSPSDSYRPMLRISFEVGEEEDKKLATVSSRDQRTDETYDRRRDNGLYTHVWHTELSVGIAPADKPEEDHLFHLGFKEERQWDMDRGTSSLVAGDNASHYKKTTCNEIFSRGPEYPSDFGGRVGGPHGRPEEGGKAVVGAEIILASLKQYATPPQT